MTHQEKNIKMNTKVLKLMVVLVSVISKNSRHNRTEIHNLILTFYYTVMSIRKYNFNTSNYQYYEYWETLKTNDVIVWLRSLVEEAENYALTFKVFRFKSKLYIFDINFKNTKLIKVFYFRFYYVCILAIILMILKPNHFAQFVYIIYSYSK